MNRYTTPILFLLGLFQIDAQFCDQNNDKSCSDQDWWTYLKVLNSHSHAFLSCNDGVDEPMILCC